VVVMNPDWIFCDFDDSVFDVLMILLIPERIVMICDAGLFSMPFLFSCFKSC